MRHHRPTACTACTPSIILILLRHGQNCAASGCSAALRRASAHLRASSDANRSASVADQRSRAARSSLLKARLRSRSNCAAGRQGERVCSTACQHGSAAGRAGARVCGHTTCQGGRWVPSTAEGTQAASELQCARRQLGMHRQCCMAHGLQHVLLCQPGRHGPHLQLANVQPGLLGCHAAQPSRQQHCSRPDPAGSCGPRRFRKRAAAAAAAEGLQPGSIGGRHAWRRLLRRCHERVRLCLRTSSGRDRRQEVSKLGDQAAFACKQEERTKKTKACVSEEQHRPQAQAEPRMPPSLCDSRTTVPIPYPAMP